MKQSEKIKEPIYNELNEFEKKFFDSMSSDIALLNRVSHFIVNKKGKQLRPMLVFLCAKLINKEVNEIYNAIIKRINPSSSTDLDS